MEPFLSLGRVSLRQERPHKNMEPLAADYRVRRKGCQDEGVSFVPPPSAKNGT